MFGFSCNPCKSPGDPADDTVKVDMCKTLREEQEEREKRERVEAEAQALEDQEQIFTGRDKTDAPAEADALAQDEPAASVEGSSEQKEVKEEEARRRQEEEEAVAGRLAEEQRILAEQEAKEQIQKEFEEARMANEATEKAAEEANEADMKKKRDQVLKDYGITDVNQKKKSLMSSKYAIHHAVEKRDKEAVRVLLHFRAEVTSLNSSKKTALQIAEKSIFTDETIVSMLKGADSSL